VGYEIWDIYGFSVQVFDPNIDNYTNWVGPYGWTHVDSVEHVGDELWITWCDPTHQNPINAYEPPRRVGFDHPGIPAWGHWTMSGYSDPSDPLVGIEARSSDFTNLPDGYGYRVHVPVAVTSAKPASWGTIKALYR
jgi:hypothetical protein